MAVVGYGRRGDKKQGAELIPLMGGSCERCMLERNFRN